MSQAVPPAAAPRRRRWSRPVVLAFVAVAVLGGAGWSIWSSVGDEAMRALAEYQRARNTPPSGPTQPPGPPVDRPIDDDELANWSEVAIFHAGANRPRPVVVVRRARQALPPDVMDGVVRGAVAREVIRQGVILAAREGFDVVVRDPAIGDPDEPGPADATYRLGSFLQTKKHETARNPNGGRITIVAGTGKDRRVVWHRTLDCMDVEWARYFRLVGQVESLARHEWRDLMAGWKLPPRAPRPPTAPDALPDGVEARLDSVAETEQFAALRALHDATRRDGGSPTRWLALARGYALLGSLVESLPSAAHAVFKARGLLYARMAVDAAPGSAAGLRGQAFAEAFAGMPFAARSDLDDADKADKADGSSARIPRVDLLRAYLAIDPEALGRVAAADPDNPVPLYLGAIAQSRLSGFAGDDDRICRNEIAAAVDAVLARVPDCHRAVDALCRSSGVAGLHRATTIDLESFAATSAARVAAVPGLPATVQARGGEAVDEFALRQALVQAAIADPNELSWGVLAALLRDIRFVQVCHRLHFLAYPLGAGAAEFLEAARPLVADHPNHDFLELYGGALDRDQALALVDRLDFADFEVKDAGLTTPIRNLDQARSRTLWQRELTQSDWGLAPDMERIVRNQGAPAVRAAWAKALLHLDPSSPVGRGLLAGAEWAMVAPQVAAWEAEQPWNTVLVAEHGFQLLKAKQYAEAQGRFETAMGRSPEIWIFRGLATSYREQGRIDEWVKAAGAMMEQPDQALDHANAANDLARFLMKRGEVDRAWPWAERAAESWAAWAMLTASECAEMRRDWTNAEAWIARTSQRYPANWLDWAAWCVRTGHGNPKIAAALLWQLWEAGRRPDSVEQGFLLGDLALILDRADITREIAAGQLAAQPQATPAGVLLALAYDRLGDAKNRDAVMDAIVAEPNPSGPKTARMIGHLVAWHRDPAAPLDLAPIEALIASIEPQNRPASDTTVALILLMYGQADRAVPYLKRADITGNNLGFRLLARHALQARGEPLGEFLRVPPKAPDQAPATAGDTTPSKP